MRGQMTMVAPVVVLAVMVLVGVLAVLFGADSRPGPDQRPETLFSHRS